MPLGQIAGGLKLPTQRFRQPDGIHFHRIASGAAGNVEVDIDGRSAVQPASDRAVVVNAEIEHKRLKRSGGLKTQDVDDGGLWIVAATGDSVGTSGLHDDAAITRASTLKTHLYLQNAGASFNHAIAVKVDGHVRAGGVGLFPSAVADHRSIPGERIPTFGIAGGVEIPDLTGSDIELVVGGGADVGDAELAKTRRGERADGSSILEQLHRRCWRPATARDGDAAARADGIKDKCLGTRAGGDAADAGEQK